MDDNPDMLEDIREKTAKGRAAAANSGRKTAVAQYYARIQWLLNEVERARVVEDGVYKWICEEIDGGELVEIFANNMRPGTVK